MFSITRKRSSTAQKIPSSSSLNLSSSPSQSSSRESLSEPEESTLVDYRELKKPVIEGLSKLEGDPKRSNILREIYTSEVAYLNGLTKLILVVARPLKSLGLKSPFTDPEKKSLFSNAEVLRRHHHNFIGKLDERFAEWTSTSPISDLFVDLAKVEEDYIEYCKNHDSANVLFEQIAARPKVQSFIKKIIPHTDGQPIPALLILPVQRIPRYELLLRDLIKQTPPEHPDSAGLQSAAERIKDISSKINEEIRAHQKAQAFTDVKSIHGIEDLRNNQERFLYECSYTVLGIDTGYPIDDATKARLKQEYGTEARILLFNNILIYTKKEKSKKKKDKSKEKIASAQGVAGKRFFLHSLWVDEQEDERVKLTLMAPELRIYLEAGSVLDKNQTVQHINEAISIWCQARSNLVRTVDGVARRVFNHNFSDGRKYKGDWGRCIPFGQCRIQFPNNNVYEGHCENLVLCGQGKMVFMDTSVYDGEWKDNLPHGTGTLQFANQSGFYTGSWVQGLPDGYGEIAWMTTGDSYAGHWSKGKMNGQGLYYFADGGFYFGEWRDGLWDGKGLWRSADGSSYEGELAHHQRHGQGKMTYSTGDIYVGQWSNDQRHGTGRFTFSNQRGYYEGEWEENFQNGWGRLELANGLLYEGEWSRGKRKGTGKQRFPDRTEYEGNWSDGKRTGEGNWTHPNGSKYSGSWHNDTFFGDGHYWEADGSHYNGKWIRGHRTGFGTQTYANGDTYTGDWKNDKRTGKGTYVRASALGITLRYEGYWENDTIHGHGSLTIGEIQHEGEFAHTVPHGPAVETNAFLGLTTKGSWEDGARQGLFTVQKEASAATTQLWHHDRPLTFPDLGFVTSTPTADPAAASESLVQSPIEAIMATSKGSSHSGALPYVSFQPVIPLGIYCPPQGADLSMLPTGLEL